MLVLTWEEEPVKCHQQGMSTRVAANQLIYKMLIGLGRDLIISRCKCLKGVKQRSRDQLLQGLLSLKVAISRAIMEYSLIINWMLLNAMHFRSEDSLLKIDRCQIIRP
jgi:hypothetical protein